MIQKAKAHPTQLKEGALEAYLIIRERGRPEATSSRGRSLALADRLAVSLATAKRLPSAKERAFAT
ncbi:conserved hypothetical protein [Ricinus communis]|uniref:Uncharacterized protein n=1 Tax=Ricinus communis TaxID=3988 RepID=B9T9Y9_RICCO|nr:conserved hypothetical protein [Ricinus communis]